MNETHLAGLGAKSVADWYEEVETRFEAITRRAGPRFDRRDWAGIAADAAERLDLYSLIVGKAAAAVADLLGDRILDKSIWALMKASYSGFAMDRQSFELAETFFNSITRRTFMTVGVDPRLEFVDTDFDTPPTESRDPVFRTYERPHLTSSLVASVLEDAGFGAGFSDLAGDARLVSDRIEEHLISLGAEPVVDSLEMISAVFYRGKGAYLVGRLFSGSRFVPIVLALEHQDGGISVDAVLLTENEVSVLFSFAHSYFHVAGERPYDLVRFLRALVPRKRPSELYISLGRNRHGKTELFRELRQHLENSNDIFTEAPGKRGLVMAVFTLPGFEMVFKVIRDHFPPQKRITPNQVMDKYRLVFRHDRAGRLVDSQSFEHLQFGAERFDKALLDLLLDECSRSVRLEGSVVSITRTYTQRRVVPLDVFLRNAPYEAGSRAVVDYGNAIRDLAVTGIFPGDLLLKNFGVTRNERVVFYDYDELTEMQSCRFRDMPVATSIEDEMSATPWFPVGADDIFPSEFSSFLGLPDDLRALFLGEHAELLEARWWIDVQSKLNSGELVSIYPYSRVLRLTPDG